MAAATQTAPSFRPRMDGWRPRNPHLIYNPRFAQQGFAGIPNPGGYMRGRGDPRQSRWAGPHRDTRPGYNPTISSQSARPKRTFRRTIDYNASVIKTIESRIHLGDSEDVPIMFPDPMYSTQLTTPSHMTYNPISCVTTKFMRQSTNKIRCPIFCVAWTPEGRRLVTGASSGEFTLWNGLTFNFETILQAHDCAVRSMVWSHDHLWMITGDHNGFVKYWQSNMNNVKMFQAHKDPIRGLSFSPTDNKFASVSDDGSVRLFDFHTCTEERLLKGHGADVKCVDWHPQKSIIASGSKDTQQPIKLWDARTGLSLATIHAHKNTVMSMKWNMNGNWFLTASRDHLVKLFDIRNMKSDFQTFKGHEREATIVAWHPQYEDFFASGGSDGAIKFWSVGTDKEVGANDAAHEGFIWSLAWHPLGHILCSASNDHSTKFWARNKPGDTMRDRYNLNLVPTEGEEEEDQAVAEGGAPQPTLPGMGTESEEFDQIKQANSDKDGIPGLDFVTKNANNETFLQEKKGRYTYTKKIDRSFAAAWEGKALPQQNQQQDYDRFGPDQGYNDGSRNNFNHGPSGPMGPNNGHNFNGSPFNQGPNGPPRFNQEPNGPANFNQEPNGPPNFSGGQRGPRDFNNQRPQNFDNQVPNGPGGLNNRGPDGPPYQGPNNFREPRPDIRPNNRLPNKGPGMGLLGLAPGSIPQSLLGDAPHGDGPGPQRDGPGPQRDGPGPYRDGPGPPRDGPGPQREGPGPYRDGPGPQRDGPGPQRDGPGPYRDGTGPSRDGPGPHTDGLGPQRDGPGLHTDGPGSRPINDNLAPATDGPGGPRHSGPGTWREPVPFYNQGPGGPRGARPGGPRSGAPGGPRGGAPRGRGGFDGPRGDFRGPQPNSQFNNNNMSGPRWRAPRGAGPRGGPPRGGYRPARGAPY